MSSAGADAVEFAATCGLILDEWQVWCLDQLLAEDAVGEWVAQQAVLICPRQNGKNAVLEALELYAFYVLDESRIIHTAHLGKTAADHMQRMVGLVRSNPELDEITQVFVANGKEALERTDSGARLEFITRGRRSVRGGSPRRLVFDEALFLTDQQMQAILPSLSAQSMDADGAPQFIYTSSAPLPESEVLHRVRDRGMRGDARRMFFAEWSCEPDVDPLDRSNWWASNPGMGIRISEEWVAENELSTMSREAFLVERLGAVLDEGGGKAPKLPVDRWEVARSGAVMPDGPVVLAFDVSPDSEWSSIVVAGGDQSHPFVELVEHRKSTDWVPGRLVELVERSRPVRVAAIWNGPAGALVAAVLLAFAEAGFDVQLEPLQMPVYRQACAAFFTDVVEGRLSWFTGSGALDMAARDAAAREVGDAWQWDIRNVTVPISPLVAATVARALLPVEVPKKPPGLARVVSF